MNMAKYRQVFVEESADHLAEMSSALLELEKNLASGEAIDLIFRMAHSIKGMAASLEYDSVTQVAHGLEDRMQGIRRAGRVADPEELALLFRGLEGLESMIASIRTSGQVPPADPALVSLLADRRDEPRVAAPASVVADPPKSSAPPARADEPPARSAAPPVTADRTGSLDAPKPPQSIRVKVETLDRFLGTVGEVILSSNQLRTAGAELRDDRGSFSVGLDRMDRVVGDLQRRALELRTAPLSRIVDPLPRMAREVARGLGKRVELEIHGAEIEVDRSILDRLSDPLVHLVRNAVGHGIELPSAREAAGKSAVGRIEIDARRVKDSIRISIRDDGAGIDLERVRERAVAAGLVVADLAEDLSPEQIAALVFQPGISTAEVISELSGRGVGMDAVRATIESLGGQVEIATERGRGTATTMIVPITAAVQRVLLVAVSGETVAVPVAKIERIVEVPLPSIERSGRDAFTLIEDEPVAVFPLAEYLCLPAPAPRAPELMVLAEVRSERMAIKIDGVVGHQQIYVKPVPELLSNVRPLAGLTILGNGLPVFLLDLNQLG
jgi:two-component system chemotaxis sensor kinase CheA